MANFEAMQIRIPDPLPRGARVAVLSTARKITLEEMQPAFSWLERLGLVPVPMPHLFEVYHQFAGTDAQRLADFQSALDDPDIHAIWHARGGYGSLRIADQVDWSTFAQKPKWMIGFSDITVWLNDALAHGVASIHGPMAFSVANGVTVESLEYLRRILLEGWMPKYTWINSTEHAQNGTAVGALCGGNLSILSQMIGTNSSPETRNRILFLEDLDEYLYHIDRMMIHLQRSGVLRNATGVVTGGMTQMKDNALAFGRGAERIVYDAVDAADVPVCSGLPAGHLPQNFPLIIGAQTRLEVRDNQATLTQFRDENARG